MTKLYRMLFALIFSVFCIHANAQVTTATISGWVTDANGEGLPGATVIAVHEPTGTQYGISTQVDGRFTIPNMRVGGPYMVTISFVGYQQQKIENISLSLGERRNLDVQLLDEATQLQEVVITGDGEFASDRTGASSSFDNAQIQKMPTITRSASDIYRLTPSSDGNSFAGRNDQFNNFSLDGSIFNNPFGLDAATPGGQTDAQPISLDAIDQIQVSLAPYDVTQAGFTGASVNAVTKSGTNKISGTVFGFFRNDNLTGSKVDGREIVVPDLEQIQAGFSIGGPIIKDKLFFFANFEMERRDDLGSNFRASRPNLSGENVSRVEAADLEMVSDVLDSRFGYQTGPYEGFIHETNNEKGIIKFDWNISQNHTLTAIYNFLDASKDKPAHPSALGRRGPDLVTLQFQNSGYRINNVIHSGLLELKSIFGNKFSNKAQVGFTKFKDSRDPFSTPIPVININRDGIRYIVAGHEPFSINNRLDQDVFQFTDNFDIFLGDHTITAGTSIEAFFFDNSFNLGVYDPFTYDGGTFGPGWNSVQEFVDAVNAGAFDDAYQGAIDTFNNNNENDSWALAETNVGQWALYVQDQWFVNRNLSLTLGLRMDMPLYFNTADKIQENIDRKGGLFPDGTYDPSVEYFDEDGNSVFFNSTDLPKQRPLFSPRFGFNWDAMGDKTLQFRGGTGLFSGRFPFVWIGNQVANPDWFFYNMTANDFKFPQVWRSNLGIDKKFGEGWIVSADLIYTKDVNSMMVRNYGLNLPTGTLPGVDNRPVYNPATDRATFNGFGFPLVTNAYVFTNTNLGRSFNTTIKVQKNFKKGLYASLAYNFLDSEDASSIEAEISSDAYDRNPALGHVNDPVLAPSLYGNRHRFVGTANKTFTYGNGKFASTLSLFFEYAQGGRFSYAYSGDINGDASGLNDLIYIPTESELEQMTFSGDAVSQIAQRLALNRFIEQDDYLSENRGDYMEKYAILSPWYSRWDFRFLQDFIMANDNRIQFSWDILNIGNLFSSSWGVREFPSNTQPIGVTLDDQGNPIYSFDSTLENSFFKDTSLLSRWQMQFGLRYIF